VTAPAAEPNAPPRTLDAFLGGLVTLVQPRTGHRAGLDAALLQAAIPADAAGQAVDLGTGSGAVAFAAAARATALAVTGVERDAELVDCALEALGRPENGVFAPRVRIVLADIAAGRQAREAAGLPDGSADWVLMNPPFDAPGRVRESPDAARRAAHVANDSALLAWCRAAAGLLRPGGTLALIHRASALPQILAALTGRFGEIRILPAHPAREAPASRIVVRAVRGSRGGLRIEPGLVLHRADGGWTEEAEAILRGRAALPR
jgi:tRNA1(Val) A37 N6-methylase TrmN6